jgi:hypothetical protein
VQLQLALRFLDHDPVGPIGFDSGHLWLGGGTADESRHQTRQGAAKQQCAAQVMRSAGVRVRSRVVYDHCVRLVSVHGRALLIEQSTCKSVGNIMTKGYLLMIDFLLDEALPGR